MQKNDPNNFSEKDLDKLLNRSFLESHLVTPENEKITEAIAAHALGVKPVSIPTKQFFIKKLIGKISLQTFLICCILLGGGITGIVLLNKTSEYPSKTNKTQPDTYRQTAGASNSGKDMEPKSNSAKINTTVYSKAPPERIARENTLDVQTTNHDSIKINSTIQKPEPIYFEDPAILFIKSTDSISENKKTSDSKSLKNDTTKKRRKAKGKFEYSIDNLK